MGIFLRFPWLFGIEEAGNELKKSKEAKTGLIPPALANEEERGYLQSKDTHLEEISLLEMESCQLFKLL